MKSLPANPMVAVVGATGAVGRVMLSILAERSFPAAEVRAIATERSRGQKIGSLVVETVEDRGFGDIDLVLIDTPDEAARQIASLAVDVGAVVIDNSAAWRMEPGVPLVIPEVNPAVVGRNQGIISSPNCTTIAMVVPLAALHGHFGVERVVVSSYQSVSGAGRAGVEELREQAAKLADQMDALSIGEVDGSIPDPQVFTAPIAFNVIPQVGSIRDEGFTGEEQKMGSETRKIMELPDLPVAATCVRVPTVAGHGVSVHARFGREVDVDEALEVLRSAPGVEIAESPTVLLSAGNDACFVGRVRRDPDDPQSLMFFSTCDNLRKGAALNAVQIAELLLPSKR